ncbi:MAG: hypothetical protein M1334_01610 [Patescibacteria group bacterium]|nr:hypothetical protein [Patescibacteria group bacterium]
MSYNEILKTFSLVVLVIVFGAQVIDDFKIKTGAFFNNFARKAGSLPAQAGFGKISKIKFSEFSLSAFLNFDIFVKISWLISLASVFGYEIYLVVLQYLDWSKDPFSRMFLPPYRNISYFLIYSLPRIIGPSLIALFFSLLLWRAAKKLNDGSEGGFFENPELKIFGLSVFLTGYPGFLIYLALLVAVFLIFNFIMSIYHIAIKKTAIKSLPKFSLYFFWLPVAIFAIIITSWLTANGLLIMFNL